MDYFSLMTQKPELFQNEWDIFEIITDLDVIKDWQEDARGELNKKGLPLNWADIGIVFDDPFIVIFRDLVRFPNRQLGSYYRLLNKAELTGGPGVVVMPEYLNSTIVKRFD